MLPERRLAEGPASTRTVRLTARYVEVSTGRAVEIKYQKGSALMRCLSCVCRMWLSRKLPRELAAIRRTRGRAPEPPATKGTKIAGDSGVIWQSPQERPVPFRAIRGAR